MDFDYPFANLPSALVEPLPPVFLLLSTPTFPHWLDVGHGGTYLRGDMPESRIDDLNPGQLRAATAGEGPVLTIAGAGTGKTITLAARMAWLVSQGSSLPGSCFSRSRALPHADFPALAYSRINTSWPGTCGNAFMPRMERAEIVVVRRAAQGASCSTLEMVFFGPETVN